MHLEVHGHVFVVFTRHEDLVQWRELVDTDRVRGQTGVAGENTKIKHQPIKKEKHNAINKNGQISDKIFQIHSTLHYERNIKKERDRKKEREDGEGERVGY